MSPALSQEINLNYWKLTQMPFAAIRHSHPKSNTRILQCLAGIAALAITTCGSATPATFTDIVDPTDVLLNDPGETYGFTHSILDDGFNNLTDTITAASLLIDFRDDATTGPDGSERVAIRIDLNNDGDTDDLGDVVEANFNPSDGNGEFTYTFLPPFLALTDGLLDGVLINVQTNGSAINPAFGDFYFEDSTLTVEVDRNVEVVQQIAQIPEPTSLLLMSSSLAGLALVRRGRRKAK